MCNHVFKIFMHGDFSYSVVFHVVLQFGSISQMSTSEIEL